MRTILGLGILYLLLFSVSSAEAFEEAPRITDREIVERLTRLEEGQKALDRRFDDFSERLAELRQLMLWGFGVSFAGMFALISLVIWDRRTTLAPALRRIEALEKQVAENALAAR